jgi:hypothetical protein
VAIRRGQQGIHLWFVQVWDEGGGRLLKRDDTDLTAPDNVLWTTLTHETGQCMERSQSLVPGCDGALSRFLQVGKKQTHKISGEIDGRQSLQGLVELRGDKGEEQDQGIAVTALGVACQVAFPYKVLQ